MIIVVVNLSVCELYESEWLCKKKPWNLTTTILCRINNSSVILHLWLLLTTNYVCMLETHPSLIRSTRLSKPIHHKRLTKTVNECYWMHVFLVQLPDLTANFLTQDQRTDTVGTCYSSLKRTSSIKPTNVCWLTFTQQSRRFKREGYPSSEKSRQVNWWRWNTSALGTGNHTPWSSARGIWNECCMYIRLIFCSVFCLSPSTFSFKLVPLLPFWFLWPTSSLHNTVMHGCFCDCSSCRFLQEETK